MPARLREVWTAVCPLRQRARRGSPARPAPISFRSASRKFPRRDLCSAKQRRASPAQRRFQRRHEFTVDIEAGNERPRSPGRFDQDRRVLSRIACEPFSRPSPSPRSSDATLRDAPAFRLSERSTRIISFSASAKFAAVLLRLLLRRAQRLAQFLRRLLLAFHGRLSAGGVCAFALRGASPHRSCGSVRGFAQQSHRVAPRCRLSSFCKPVMRLSDFESEISSEWSSSSLFARAQREPASAHFSGAVFRPRGSSSPEVDWSSPMGASAS